MTRPPTSSRAAVVEAELTEEAAPGEAAEAEWEVEAEVEEPEAEAAEVARAEAEQPEVAPPGVA
jgi:hypothetical protein